MTQEISSAAVGLRAPPASLAALSVLLPVAGRVPVPVGVTRKPADDAIAVSGASRDRGDGLFRRVISALGEVAGLVAVAYAFPLVILAIGIPIALLVRLVMWIAGVG